MPIKNTNYHLPRGYSEMQVIFRSFRFLGNPIQAVSHNMEKFGGTYSVVIPGSHQRLILTQDPAFINHVLRENHTNYHKSNLTSERAGRLFGKGLLFSNGDYWLIQGLYAIVVKTIEEFLVELPTGNGVDVYPLFYRLAFKIAIRSLFDIELSAGAASEISRLFGELQDFLVRDINKPLRKLLYPITKEDRIHYKKAEELRAIFRGILQQRLSDPGEYNDLLDMLLKTRYEDTGEPMAEEQVIDEMLILIMAGHETTANTLSWLLYLVASEKAVQDKLGASIEETDIYESVQNEYLQAVINESMRLRPAAWMTDRVALTDDRFGDYSFPAGTIIMSFFYGLHRHPDHWKDAQLFNADRFIGEQGRVKKSPAFFPFGAGPRMCIGNYFAMAEMSLVLYAFFSRFRISPTGLEPVMRPLMTLRPDKVSLNIERRG
jgi:cytochrome P450